MKTKASILLTCMLLIIACGSANAKTIQGNGKLVTKEISIKDYDEISALGGATIEYEQSSASPYLQVTVDENILPYLDIQVKGKKLNIGYNRDRNDDEVYEKEDKFGHKNTYRTSANIRPTKYVIKTNSQTLKDISLVAGCQLIIKSNFKTDHINSNIAGGGSIDFSQSTDFNKGDFSVAGGGSMYLRKFKATSLECSVAGGGNIQLNGKVDRADLNAAGGGDIEGYSCEARKAECNVAGGGSIQVYATDQLDASIAAGGKIRYKGNPTVSKSTVAGGSIKKYNE